MMTFEQFQATRKESNDLGRDTEDCMWDNEPKASGLLYLGKLFIENVEDWWPQRAKDMGKYHLLLGRDEWVSDDLESLERELYDWAMSAGYDD
jgi:hypothetical protein